MSVIPATLNDSIISQKAIQTFASNLAPLSAFSTDYSDELATRGASITVPLFGAIDSSTTQNDYETDTGTASPITVQLNLYRKVTVGLTDLQFQNSSAARLESFAVQQVTSLAKGVMLDIWAILTNANYAQKITKALAGFTTAELRAMKLVLDKSEVPQDARTLVLNPDYFDKVLADPTVNVLSAMAYGGTEAIRNGAVPRIIGMDTKTINVLPANGENLVGFVAHPNAMAIAMRALKPQEPSAYLESRTLTDAATGLTIGYRRHYSPAKGKHFVTFECLFGVAPALSGALVRLVSA